MRVDKLDFLINGRQIEHLKEIKAICLKYHH